MTVVWGRFVRVISRVRRARSGIGRGTRAGAVVAVGVAVCAATLATAVPARAGASPSADAQAAARLATARGYRTGIAVLNLRTGQFVGAGDDRGSFATESIAKVLIATQLLLTGQMTGAVKSTAYEMITQSDDADADELYGLVGGDDVIHEVAAHYGITFLGAAPSRPGWWGNTEINARGLVYLYAAIAKDPVVGPWLMNAMAHATKYGADGTYQFFGIPSATTGAAIKQGWGDDGDDAPNAVFNSSGYVDNDQFAVAILTDGPPSTYGTAIGDTVTAEAKALMPGGRIDDPADHNPTIADLTATASGSTVTVSGTATDPDDPGLALTVEISSPGSSISSATTDARGRFAIRFLARDGSHVYNVTADNVGEGSANAVAKTRPLVVDGDPRGQVESVIAGTMQITIRGQESDPNLVVGQFPALSVAVDNRPATLESAGALQAVTGSSTGLALADYNLVLPVKAGHHTVTVVYEHSGGGQNTTAGTWLVNVAAAPSDHRRNVVIGMVASAVGIVILLIMIVAFALATRSRHRRQFHAGRRHRSSSAC